MRIAALLPKQIQHLDAKGVPAVGMLRLVTFWRKVADVQNLCFFLPIQLGLSGSKREPRELAPLSCGSLVIRRDTPAETYQCLSI